MPWARPVLVIVARSAARVTRRAQLTELRPGIHVGVIGGFLELVIVKLGRLDDAVDTLGLHTLALPREDGSETALDRYLDHAETPWPLREAILEQFMNKALHHALPEGKTYYDLAVERGKKRGRRIGRAAGKVVGKAVGMELGKEIGRWEAVLRLAEAAGIDVHIAEGSEPDTDALEAQLIERLRRTAE